MTTAEAHEVQLKSLYRAHWQELCSYVRRTFGAGPPEPEDVVQIAFARYTALADAARVQNPRAFLYTTARNIALDQVRAQERVERYMREALAAVSDAQLEHPSAECALMAKQHFETLCAAIDTLPLKQRQVLAMSLYHEMTYETIAASTGWSLADISRQLKGALATLDAVLAAAEGR